MEGNKTMKYLALLAILFAAGCKFEIDSAGVVIRPIIAACVESGGHWVWSLMVMLPDQMEANGRCAWMVK
jgi:hypothetical protein